MERGYGVVRRVSQRLRHGVIALVLLGVGACSEQKTPRSEDESDNGDFAVGVLGIKSNVAGVGMGGMGVAPAPAPSPAPIVPSPATPAPGRGMGAGMGMTPAPAPTPAPVVPTPAPDPAPVVPTPAAPAPGRGMGMAPAPAPTPVPTPTPSPIPTTPTPSLAPPIPDPDPVPVPPAATTPDAIGQIFGGGFGAATQGELTGYLGNGGGFGFAGSIASIIGNSGGFGMGGFGIFSSYFAGTLPTTPANGIVLPTDPQLPLPTTGAVLLNGNGVSPSIDPIPLPAGHVVAMVDKSLANANLNFLFFTFQIAAGQVVVGPTNCSEGGNLTRVLDDVGVGGISTGDSVTTEFNQCARGNIHLDGVREYSVDKVAGVPFIDRQWSVTIRLIHFGLTHTNVATGDNWESNGVTVTTITVLSNRITQLAKGQSRRVSGSTGITDDDDFVIEASWNLANNTYEWTYYVEAKRLIPLTQLTSTVATTTTGIPFSGMIGQTPNKGQLTITDSTETLPTQTITMTALNDGSVRIESDSNADGVIDNTQQPLSWIDVVKVLYGNQ